MGRKDKAKQITNKRKPLDQERISRILGSTFERVGGHGGLIPQYIAGKNRKKKGKS